MKIKSLKTIKELENTIPTEQQIKNYKIFHTKLNIVSYTNRLEFFALLNN